jgi:hypothetical protein
MFTVILAVVALTDYIIIFYCIVSMVARPSVGTEETPEDFFEGGVMDYINNDYVEEQNACIASFNDDYIEEQNARIALLSSNIDEILSNIDSIVEGNKVNQGVLS